MCLDAMLEVEEGGLICWSYGMGHLLTLMASARRQMVNISSPNLYYCFRTLQKLLHL